MRIFDRRIFVSLLIVGMLAANAFLWADPPSVVGRLDFVSGSVSFQPGALDEWSPATVNYPLTAGDHLWTDQGGRAELHTGSTAIRLDSNTDFSFLSLDDQTQQVRLGSGSINVRLRSLDPGDAFEIDTPNATITLLTAGSYRVDVQQEGQASQIIARTGQAEVQAGDMTFDVSSGQSGSVTGAVSVGYWVSGAPQPNEWDGWSSARDLREDRLASVRYVPREMIGMEDLDANGVWVTVAGYGVVWQPTHVAVGWAPYRDGRWAWVAPWGWTWIDAAPWGFAPFHYGRWASVDARWVWVPGEMVARPVYAPALVVFVGGDSWRPSSVDGIGWFPLAPREVYMPPYTVSTGYVQRVNNGNLTITGDTIQRFDLSRVVYANRSNPQAITVMPRQAFTQSRQSSASALSLSSADFTRAPLMGMSATLIPQRESVAVQTLTPNATVARPPAPIADRSVFSRIKPAAAPMPFNANSANLTPNSQQYPSSADQPPASTGQQTLQPQNLQRQQDFQKQQAAQQQTAQQQTTQQQTAQQQTTQQQTTQQQTTQQQERPTQQQQDTRKQQAGQQQGADTRATIAQILKRDLQTARANLEAARKIRGIRLDFNLYTKQLNDIEAALTAADADAAAGRTAAAQKSLQTQQKLLTDEQQAVADAVKAAQGH